MKAGNYIPHTIPHKDKVYRSILRLSKVKNQGLNIVFYGVIRLIGVRIGKLSKLAFHVGNRGSNPLGDAINNFNGLA